MWTCFISASARSSKSFLVFRFTHVNKNYLSSTASCQSPECNRLPLLIPLLCCLSLSLSLLILPLLQSYCGGTVADVDFSSSLNSVPALIASLSHKQAELLYLQTATQCCSRQPSSGRHNSAHWEPFNTHSPSSASNTGGFKASD